MPLSQPNGKAVVVPIGLWGALSKEPPELRCLALYLTVDKYKNIVTGNIPRYGLFFYILDKKSTHPL